MTSSGYPSIVVLDPTAPPRDVRHDLAIRPADLRGGSVGFLWNSKPNGDLLFAKIEELLREKYEISEARYWSKRTASIPAPAEVLDEMVAGVRVAIVGLGD
jgi:hypothetical protein